MCRVLIVLKLNVGPKAFGKGVSSPLSSERMGQHEGPVTLALGHPVAWYKQGPVLLLPPRYKYPPLSMDGFTSERPYREA